MPTGIPEVQNCQGIKSVAEITKGRDHIMEPKLDGFRMLAQVRDTDVRFVSRNGKDYTGKMPWVEAELLATFPTGTILDGEAMASYMKDGKLVNDFEHTQGVLLSGVKKAIDKQTPGLGGRPLGYIVFDVLQYGSNDVRDQPLSHRRDLFTGALRQQDGKLKHVAGTVVIEPSQDMYERICALGYEGVVIKALDSRYASGLRGYGWFKIKAQPTIDVVVFGCGKPGEGRNTGKVGSIAYGQPLEGSPVEHLSDYEMGEFLKKHKLQIMEFGGRKFIRRGECGGMTDEERDYVTANLDQLVGTVIEVSHMGIFPNKVKMRHPQFVRFRTHDKRTEDIEWHDR